MTYRTKGEAPDPETQAYVADLISRIGLARAAKKLNIAKLSALNVSTGGNIYPSTVAKIAAARAVAD